MKGSEIVIFHPGRRSWPSDWFKTKKIPQLGSSPPANQDLSTMLIYRRNLRSLGDVAFPHLH